MNDTLNITLIIGLFFLAAWWLLKPSTELPFRGQISVVGRVKHIVDGDSLYIASHRPQVRLWGINTPERGEVGFQEATDHLRRIAQGRKITCEIMHTDKYGRTVGRCYLPDGRDIGGEMIKSHLAQEMYGFSKGYYSLRVKR